MNNENRSKMERAEQDILESMDRVIDIRKQELQALVASRDLFANSIQSRWGHPVVTVTETAQAETKPTTAKEKVIAYAQRTKIVRPVEAAKELRLSKGTTSGTIHELAKQKILKHQGRGTYVYANSANGTTH